MGDENKVASKILSENNHMQGGIERETSVFIFA